MGKKEFWLSIFGVPVFIGFLLYSCLRGSTACEDGAEQARSLTWYLVIENKNYDVAKRNYNYSGRNKIGKPETIEASYFHEINDIANKGDTIIINRGELFIKILKSDTIRIIEYTCDGRKIE